MVLSCSKKLSPLSRGITSKNDDFYSLNSFKSKGNLESHQKVCENEDFCNVVVPSEDTKILEFNQYHKSDKTFIIYADFESLIENIDECKINPKKSSTTEVSERIPSGFSIFTISSFKDRENKHNLYRGKGGVKKFCESLWKQAIKIIDFKKKKMKLLTNEQQELNENAKICYINNEKFEDKYAKCKNYLKVRDHCH